MNRLYAASSGMVRSLYGRYVDTPPVLDKQRYFPGYTRFEENFPEIQRECRKLMDEIHAIPQFHELMREQADLSEYGGKYWRMFVLRAYGVDNVPNLERCPAIAALLKDRSEILSATLSFLEGRKRIPAHRGPFRGILRFHLGVVVPRLADGSSSSPLMIDGKVYPLEEGQTILWDDTYMHAAWNESDGIRAALLLDIARPSLPWHLAALNWLIIKAIGLAIRLRGQESWSVAAKPAR